MNHKLINKEVNPSYDSISDIGILLHPLLTFLEFLNIDELAPSCVNFLHLFDLGFELLFLSSHHLILLTACSLLLEVILKVIWNGHGVRHVLTMHERTEHLLLTDDTFTESVELGCTVSDLLMRRFWFVDKMLTVRKIAADFLAYHHR